MSGFAASFFNFSKMDPKYENYEHLEPIPDKYGLTTILLSVIFFQIVNKIVATYCNPKSVLESEVWKWRNLFISWLHAVIVGIWSLLSFYYYPEMIQDLIAHHSLFAYIMIAFSTGYFIYDFGDIIVCKRMRKSWEVCVHHVAVSFMFTYNLMESRYVGYNCICLTAEVNSIFLHTRKLFQLRNMSFDHWAYRVNAFLNVSTFAFFRFGAIISIVYGIMHFRERLTTAYLVCLLISMILMVPINVVLFWRLLYNDFIRSRRKVRATPTQKENHNNQVNHVNSNNNIMENHINNHSNNHIKKFE